MNPTDSPNVVIIASSHYAPPWTEGVRNLMRRLAQDLVQRGMQVTIISPQTPNQPAPAEAGITIVQVSALSEWQGTHTWLTMLAHLRLLFATSWAVYRVKPKADVLLVLASASSMLGLRSRLLKLASRRPLVFYITGLSSHKRGSHLGFKADKVLVGSDFLKKWFPGAEVIYPFLSSRVDLPGEVPGTERDAFRVAFLGSFQPGRGVEMLLKAMALVKARTKAPVHLMIGWNGIGTKNYENILKLIDNLDIRSIVSLYGQVDTREFYRQIDVLVIPRTSEKFMSFPVRIVEALSAHTPLIVTRVCGMENLIQGCGLAIEPSDPEGLAEAILKLAGDERLYREMKQNCATALQRFDNRAALDRFYEIIIGLVNHD